MDRRMKLPDDEMVRILLGDPFHGAPVFVWLIGFTLSLDVQKQLKRHSPAVGDQISFNDAKWDVQWYLKDPKTTMHIMEAWKKGFTGRGVTISIVDSGVDKSHPELIKRFSQSASYNFVNNNSNPSPVTADMNRTTLLSLYDHGTRVAGLAAAEANNGICGVGVAYEAAIGGLRIPLDSLRDPKSDNDQALALRFGQNVIDIYACPWGPPDHGWGIWPVMPKTELSVKDTIAKGRKDRGGIFVFPAGNGGRMLDTCAYDGYVNSIYTIAVTSITNKGYPSTMNERCSAIMATAYTRDGAKTGSQLDDPMPTSDVSEGCTMFIEATSAAVGIASGMIALMLQANKDLTWRDVQHIIIRTSSSNPTVLHGGGWKTNGAGLRVSDYFGFGLLDANLMVQTAINWTNVPEQQNCDFNFISRPGQFSTIQPLEQFNNVCCGIRFLEHVVFTFNMNFTDRSELEAEVTSPSGVKSLLIRPRGRFDEDEKEVYNLSVLSLHFWGEQPGGKWKVVFRDGKNSTFDSGIVFNLKMTMYGTSADPLGSNTLIKSFRAMEYRGTDITVKVVIEKKVKDSRTVYGLAAGCGILSILLLGATVIIIRLRIKLRKSAASTPELMILAEAQNQQRLQR